MMASRTGCNIDDERFSQENIPPDPRSRDLPSKRLLGKGLASIGYETEWINGVSYARKDFVGVPSNIFREEADILVGPKDHQNVVKTHGLTVDKLSCSLVLEYMDDKLSGLLQKKKDQRKRTALAGTDFSNQSDRSHALLFELQEALDLMLQIARGMEFIHKQGIIHGDLKTRNILVTYKSNGDKNLSVKAVKVADFGLVQTKRNSMSYASRQVCKLDMVRWKAPENLMMLLSKAASSESDSDPDEECTHSGIAEMPSDVYSFALMCFQILTGEEPYPKRKWEDMVEDIVSGKLRPKLPPDPPCPKILSELLISCWDTDPCKRPPFFCIREKLEHMHTSQTWTVKDEQEQSQPEPLEKDCSSLKSMELAGPNSPIPEVSDADHSSKMDYSAPDSAALLRKGKDLMPEYLEPNESITNVLRRTGERETFEEIHDPIQTESRPDDAVPSDQFRSDDLQIVLDPRGGPASSGAMDDQTELEPRRSRKRLRGHNSSSAMDVDYDVFLNHRGPDVKGGFVAHLEEALRSVGLNPFVEQEVLKGDPIFMSINNALEVAKVHVVVISRGYAESKYCLHELVDILRRRTPVVPVFYDVEPWHLHQAENGPFAEAFEKHRRKQPAVQVEEWRDALHKLADISGFHLSDYHGDEAKLKQSVVDAILSFINLKETLPHDLPLVGMNEHMNLCMKKLEKMSSATCVLGLVGMGGIGKTLLAKKIYNHFVGHKKFQAMSFLEFDHKSPLSLTKRLQKQLLWDLLSITMKELEVNYTHWFQKVSSRGPMLIVLDNIYDKSQFDELIRDSSHLPQGSCIIATSHDRHLLKLIAGKLNFYLHEVKPLGCDDSQKLFNWHAFGDKEAPQDFKTLANDISKACGGLPLALKVVGSILFGKTSDEDQECIWPEAIEALKVERSIVTALKWSYDNLSEPEKLMFVDIASIFYGRKKEEALEVWKSCKECSSCYSSTRPLTSLRCLIDNSLVVLECLEGDEILAMHSLLKGMGEDIGNSSESHLNNKRATNAILADKFQGTNKVRALNFENVEQHFIDTKFLTKMSNLHFLILNGCETTGTFENISKELRLLQWRCMPMTYLPPMPNLFNLVSLDISMNTKLTDAGSTFQGCPNLLRLDMSWCTSITMLPDSIGHLSRLKALDLHGCWKLQQLPSSIGQLISLELLNLQGCESLKALPNTITSLARLQRLHIEGCSSLSKLPPGIGNLLAGLTSLSIDLATEEQAAGLRQVNALKHLTVMHCTDEAITMVDSSDALRKMDQLKELNFSSCKAITKLPETIGLLTNLNKLRLFSCEGLKELPNSIGLLRALKTLELRECRNLMTLPESLGELTSLEYLSIVRCATLTEPPLLTKEGYCQLQLLPDSLGQLNALQFLQILDCGNLEALGVLPVLQGLRIWGCTSITAPIPGSCLIVLDSDFWDPSWYYDIAEYFTVVRRNLREVRVVEENDSGFLRIAVDDQTERLILQRVYTSYYELVALDM